LEAELPTTLVFAEKATLLLKDDLEQVVKELNRSGGDFCPLESIDRKAVGRVYVNKALVAYAYEQPEERVSGRAA
jgi:hypothetical protein